MASVLAAGLGLVAGVFLLIVAGEVYYLFYWRKRPRTFARGGSVTVAPITEAEAAAVGSAVIDVTCAEYQIAALHQDLVEKLFPAAGGGVSEDSPQNLMGPTRMLFTITEETKEELEGLDLDGKGGARMRSRRSSRSKSMSDISVSPLGPLSPASTPFGTPFSSPDVLSPYGTPTYSPMVPQTRSVGPVALRTSCRIMYDYSTCSPPPGPPSPTRPSSPFLGRATSPGKSQEFLLSNGPVIREMGAAPNTNSGPFYSPPRKPFAFAAPRLRGPAVDGLACGKAASPLRACTYVYDNGTFSPSSPSSPRCFPPSPMARPLTDYSRHEIPQDHHPSDSPSPFASPHSSASSSCSSAASSLLTPLSTQSSPPDSAGMSPSPGSSCSSPRSSRNSSSTVLSSSPEQSYSVPADQPQRIFGQGSCFPPKREGPCLPPSGSASKE